MAPRLGRFGPHDLRLCFTGDVGDDDAPMLLALGDQVIKCTGRTGMILVRDVSVWHRGTAHMGRTGRIMPSCRFATAAAHRAGHGAVTTIMDVTIPNTGDSHGRGGRGAWRIWDIYIYICM